MQAKAGKFIIVTGARPCFIKALPLAWEMQRRGIHYEIFNPCQHYDPEMGKIFEKELAAQHVFYGERKEENPIRNIQEMVRQFESYIKTLENVRGVFVVGDVNASLACAFVAKKREIPLVHIEAGLRSFDISMPEELNRIAIDHLADINLTHCQDAVDNLAAENIKDHVYPVGNLGMDALCKILPQTTAGKGKIPYVLATIHRRENLDHPERFRRILEELNVISLEIPVVFPVHPHTRKKIPADAQFFHEFALMDPVGYVEFVGLMRRAEIVITDSGGIQEETTYLGIPCLTVRDNTERPITITEGTNRLVRPEDLSEAVRTYVPREGHKIPDLWDGHTAERILLAIMEENL